MSQSENLFGKNEKLRDSSEQAIRDAHRRKWTFVGSITVVAAIIGGLYFYEKSSSSETEQLAAKYNYIDAKYQKEIEYYTSEGEDVSHKESSRDYEKFALANPNSQFGWLAASRAAQYFITDSFEFDRAEKLLKIMLDQSTNPKFDLYRQRLLLSYGQLQHAQGKNDGALATIDKLLRFPDTPYSAQAKLIKAKILKSLNKDDEAKAVLGEIAQNDNLSRQVALLKSRWFGNEELPVKSVEEPAKACLVQECHDQR